MHGAGAVAPLRLSERADLDLVLFRHQGGEQDHHNEGEQADEDPQELLPWDVFLWGVGRWGCVEGDVGLEADVADAEVAELLWAWGPGQAWGGV